MLLTFVGIPDDVIVMLPLFPLHSAVIAGTFNDRVAAILPMVMIIYSEVTNFRLQINYVMLRYVSPEFISITGTYGTPTGPPDGLTITRGREGSVRTGRVITPYGSILIALNTSYLTRLLFGLL